MPNKLQTAAPPDGESVFDCIKDITTPTILNQTRGNILALKPSKIKMNDTVQSDFIVKLRLSFYESATFTTGGKKLFTGLFCSYMYM